MTKKQKILYVITKSNWGGAQRYVYDLAINLPKDKFEITVALGGEGPLMEKLIENGIEVIQIPKLARDIKLSDEVFVFFNLIQLLRKEKPDIVHLNSSKIGGLGALAACINNFIVWVESFFLKTKNLKLKTKIIFTAHGWAYNEERSLLSRVIIKLLAWFTVALSHKIIAVSQKILNESPKLFLPKNKLSLIHNGVSSKTFLSKENATAELKDKLAGKWSDSGLKIVTVAELHRNKGLTYSIEAMNIIKKIIPDISYIIFGEGEERKNLEKLIHHQNLYQYVHLAGFLDDAPKYLKAFDFFILPSITEALGLSILEAGMAELPIVATSVGGIPEIIEDMKTGILVRPKAPEEIASAIKFLIENTARATELGKNLHVKVVRDFSLQRMLEKTIGIYYTK